MSVDSLNERAEEHLRFIRDAMARASSFTAVPGLGGIVMGASALIAAGVAARAGGERAWLLVWLLDAAFAVPVGAFTMAQKAKRSGIDLGSGVGRLFVGLLTPPIVAGGVLTLALVSRESYTLLPAVWLLLYGTAVAVGGAMAVRPVRLMGAGFMVLGASAAFAPLWIGNLLMAAGFGLLQVIVGTIVMRDYGG